MTAQADRDANTFTIQLGNIMHRKMVLQPSFLKPLHKASELRTKICIYACQHSSNVPNYRHNKKTNAAIP